MRKLSSIKFFTFFFVLLISYHIGVKAQSDIVIGTWNLDHFGKTKSDETIKFIAKTINSCDILAIQEVVGEFGGFRAVKRLTAELNALSNSNEWESIVSVQTTGNSYQDERYAYVWNKSKITLVGTGWLDQKYASEIDREPYLATFKSKKKEFTLVNFHAVPKSKNPEHEIKYLKYFSSEYPELNLIFLGDFNCPEKNNVFNPLKSKGYKPVLVNQKTTLRMKCNGTNCLASEFDNIFYKENKIKFISSGIIYFYQLFPDMKAARKVSDHVPVVFTFSIK